jgi:hypothetical protein
VPNFQLVAANAVLNFQLVAANTCAKFSICRCKCSAEFSNCGCKCSANSISGKISPRDAGTMWRQGGQIFVKGHFWIDIQYTIKKCLQNIGSWTSPNHVFYLLDDRGVRGSPPGDCAILEARWLHFLRFLKQIRKRIALTISDNSLFRQGNPLNWKGTFAPLAPPGKGQRGAAAPPAHQFRRPWYLRFIIVFIRFAKYRIVLKICQQDNFPFWIKIRDFTKKRHCYSHLLQVHSISFKFPNFLQCCSSQWLYWVLLQILIKCRESCMNDW